MSSRTIFLSRLLGAYLAVVALAMMVHPHTTLSMVNQLDHDPPVLFLLGVITVAIGLALVVGHNVWSGGALPVTLSVLGWISLIKGLAFLLMAPEGVANLLAAMHYEQWYAFYLAISVVVGAYLIYGGMRYKNAE